MMVIYRARECDWIIEPIPGFPCVGATSGSSVSGSIVSS